MRKKSDNPDNLNRKRVVVLMNGRDSEDIEALAQALGQSVSGLCRRIIKDFIKDNAKEV